MMKSEPLHSEMSVVAFKWSFLEDKNASISLSTIGDFLELIKHTFSSIMSIAVTSYFLEMRTAKDKPTYPVPTTEIFINEPFLGGRHQKRVDFIKKFEH